VKQGSRQVREVCKIAFISGKSGAWIPVHDLASPHLRVNGLKNGIVTVIQSHAKDGTTIDHETVIHSDGLTVLPTSSWLRVLYEGSCKQVLCHVVNKRAA